MKTFWINKSLPFENENIVINILLKSQDIYSSNSQLVLSSIVFGDLSNCGLIKKNPLKKSNSSDGQFNNFTLILRPLNEVEDQGHSKCWF